MRSKHALRKRSLYPFSLLFVKVPLVDTKRGALHTKMELPRLHIFKKCLSLKKKSKLWSTVSKNCEKSLKDIKTDGLKDGLEQWTLKDGLLLCVYYLPKTEEVVRGAFKLLSKDGSDAFNASVIYVSFSCLRNKVILYTPTWYLILNWPFTKRDVR